MELHIAIGQALAHIVDEKGKDNAILKQMIDEIEASLIPRPLFAKPLTIVYLMEYFLGHSQKFKKIT